MTQSRNSAWVGAWLLSGCVADFGDLGDVPELPASSGPMLFEPLPPASGASEPEPEPEPEPTSVPPVPQPEPVDPEPNGRGAFTLIHGVIDAPRGAFCVVLYDGDEVRFDERPLPPNGLEFGEAVVLPMADVIFPETTDVQFLFVAAEPQHLARGCRELLSAHGYEVPEEALGVELAHESRGPLDAGVPADGGERFLGATDFDFDLRTSGSFDLGVNLVQAAFPGELADAGAPDVAIVDAATNQTPADVDAALALDASAPAASALDAAAPDMASLDAALPGAVTDAAQPIDAETVFVPADVRVVELPRLLAGTYLERSYLFATGGCIGGPGFDATLVGCGPGFEAERSTFSAVFVPLSRVVDFDAVGLQVVHANQTLGELTVRSDPGTTEGSYFTLASGLVLGGVQPFTAQRSLDVAALGEPLSSVMVSVATWPDGSPLLEVPWAETLAPNRVELDDGRAFTLVLIGGAPMQEPGPYANRAALTAIESDPLRE